MQQLRRRRIVATIVALVVLVAGGLLLRQGLSRTALLEQPETSVALPSRETPPPTTAPPSPWPSPTPSPTPTASPSPSAATAQCSHSTSGFTPTSFTLARVGAKERVIAMRTQGGQIPAPPKNDRRSAGWWSDGPRPGADHGKVVLTIHTYRPSLRPALGNELYDGGESALRPGDVPQLHAKDGRTVCYEFVEAQRIMVADYDPSSRVMLDPDGEPSAVIVICWDFSSSTKDWDSRVFFQFRRVTG